MVAQEDDFSAGDVLLLLGRRLVDGFELESRSRILASAIAVSEEERVSAEGERECNGAEDAENWLAGAGFVAAYLDDVGAGVSGELMLRERPGPAHGGDASGPGVGHELASECVQCGEVGGDQRSHLLVPLTHENERSRPILAGWTTAAAARTSSRGHGRS